MKYCILISIMFFSVVSFSQDIVLNDPAESEAELHVAINPTDSNNIVVAVQRLTNDGSVVSIYYSYDFGSTWNRSTYEGRPPTHFFSGDPVIAFDDQGNVLLVTLIADFNFFIELILSKSINGGKDWQQVSSISNNDPDKPWMAIDRSNASPHKGNIYVPVIQSAPVLYTLDTSYQELHSVFIADGDHLPSVVVNNDGDVFTSFVTLSNTNDIYVQKFTNGGTQLAHSTLVTSIPDYTFNVPEISFRFQPTAYMAVDNSGGPYDGRIYMSYTASEDINPNYFDVLLKYSDDDGLTWSSAKTVHSDKSPKVNQFYSSLYVNDDGVLIMDWYDRKNYGTSSLLTDFYMGISHDGGDNFTELKINSAATDFTNVVPANYSFSIGEYHQLVATSHTAIAFWADGRKNDGDLNVYFAKVNIDNPNLAIERGMVIEQFGLSPLYPVPAKDVLNTLISLSEASKVKYQIINSLGQTVQDSEWKKYTSGDHELQVELDHADGVYILQVMTEQGYFRNQSFNVRH